MKAIVIENFGGPEEFKVKDIPVPELKIGYILIKVKASSVNPIDFKVRKLGLPIAPALPAVLHGDVSGIVEEVSPEVTKFKKGDEVYGCCGGFKGEGGALAEYMLADADFLALKPSSLSFTEAATLPLVSITAWESLIDRAKIQKGQKVLVHGACGGVGHIGIQLAKAYGAKVYATASSDEKIKTALELGADVAINYTQEKVKDYVKEYTDGNGFDIVFDTVGTENIDRSFEAARLKGTVVSIATRSSHNLTVMHMKGLTLHVVFMLIPMLFGSGRAHQGEILSNIRVLVDQGIIKPLLHKRIFNFEEVGEAHKLLEEGKAMGKIALKI